MYLNLAKRFVFWVLYRSILRISRKKDKIDLNIKKPLTISFFDAFMVSSWRNYENKDEIEKKYFNLAKVFNFWLLYPNDTEKIMEI